MSEAAFRLLIEQGDLEGLHSALERNPALANAPIRWGEVQSDPLHFVSDCVFNGLLTNGTEADIARRLLAHGAAINGSDGRESPLIGSTSLGVELVSEVLIDAGADLEATSIFAGRALHWATWMGSPETVRHLLSKGAAIEVKCSEFEATPLFWGVHGYGPNGARVKRGQVEAVRLLIQAGAKVDTANKEGCTALELAKQCAGRDMVEVLSEALGAR